MLEALDMGLTDILKGKSRAQKKGPEGVAAGMPRPGAEAGCRLSRPLRPRRPEPNGLRCPQGVRKAHIERF